MKKDKIKQGITGEFLVLSKLSALGYIAAPTLKNTPGIDILVSNGVKAKMVQVKTTDNKNSDWICPMPKQGNKDLVYIFVNLNTENNGIPSFHIAPSAEVIEVITSIDNLYNAARIKKGKPRFNAEDDKKGVSHFKDLDQKYKDKWNLLGLQT
jgi:hypothetical protein